MPTTTGLTDREREAIIAALLACGRVLLPQAQRKG